MDAINRRCIDADALDTESSQFLMDEGLQLLASYRAIANPSVRLAISDLVRALAEDESQSGPSNLL